MNKASKGSSLQMGLGFLSLSVLALGFIASTALSGKKVESPRAYQPTTIPTVTPKKVLGEATMGRIATASASPTPYATESARPTKQPIPRVSPTPAPKY